MPVLNLTAQSMKGIQPPTVGAIEYWDAATPGLCLRVFASGRRSWSFRYRPREGGKKNERITFGSSEILSLADARDRAARVRAEVVDGGNPQLTRRQKREAAKLALTFDALADRYLSAYAKARKASWKHDEQRLGRAREAFGTKAADSITRRDVIHFLDEVKRTAPVQANRIQTIICTMFNWAVEEELLETNPIAGLRKRAKEAAGSRTLSDPEIRVLWRALEAAGAETEAGRDVADALIALLLTGQRPGEVAGTLQHEVVALGTAEARWEIPGERMKGRRPHVVPLAPIARRIFENAITRRRQQNDKNGVFGSRYLNRKTLARHSLSQALKRVVRGLDPDMLDSSEAEADALPLLQQDPPTPHDFRRTVATGMAALGVPREDRKAVLGHVPGDIHGTVYDKYERLREKRAALALWETHLTAITGRHLPSDPKIPL
jgi:integrase